MKCEICEEECETIDEHNSVCDSCWYGMRLRPDDWLKEMEDKGIKIERGMGCNVVPGVGFFCGDPYQKARVIPMEVRDEK